MLGPAAGMTELPKNQPQALLCREGLLIPMQPCSRCTKCTGALSVALPPFAGRL